MWNVTRGFSWSPMHYNNSCFPSCLSMIIRNKNIGITENALEVTWEHLQQTNPPYASMNVQAPTLAEIGRNISFTIPNDLPHQIFWASQAAPFDDATATTMQQKLAVPLTGIILAAQNLQGHARLVFRMPDGYVHLSASPDLQIDDDNFVSQISVTYVGGGVRIADSQDDSPLCGGDYAILL